MLEALEKLREYRLFKEGKMHSAYFTTDKIIDEIQAEIDASYMRLPVDADGVPIHVGDEMKQNGVKIGCVTAVGFHVEPRAWVLPKGRNVSVSFVAEGIRHVKPRTLESVLLDMLGSYYRKLTGSWATLTTDEELASGYADEIRELLGGEAE